MMRRVVDNIELFLASLLMIGMFIFVLADIGMRAITGSSLVWVGEVSRVMLVWSVFLGVGAAIKRKGLVSVDSLYGAMPVRIKAIFDAVVLALLLFVGWNLTYHGWEFLMRVGRDTMPITGLPSRWLYASAPLGGVIIIVRSLEVYGQRIWVQLRGQHTSEPEPLEEALGPS
jgi:TRAP-type C4-dicarboxylate transport system permease small subunit